MRRRGLRRVLLGRGVRLGSGSDRNIMFMERGRNFGETWILTLHVIREREDKGCSLFAMST